MLAGDTASQMQRKMSYTFFHVFGSYVGLKRAKISGILRALLILHLAIFGGQ